MKKICCAALFGLTGAVLLPAAGLAANVCGQGVGIPPFLSSGAKPNLLMVLDNSGSMLDASYSEDGSFCFDDTYDSTETYAGYFQNDQWYQWSESPYKPWQSGVTYTGPSGSNRGSIVYVQGVFWEATSVSGSVSNGTSPENDISATWKRLFTIAKWKNATAYPAKSFVWEGPQLYYTAAGGTSNDTVANNVLRVADDTGITDWKAVDSTWLNDTQYNKGDLVTYRGILYEADNSAKSSGTGVYDDSKVTWKTLDEGSFVAVSKTAATSACSSAAGATDKYTQSDLCISLKNDVTPAQVPAFAARGNLLNWAMSSKFDVEKKILTGGKYNYKEDILVSEHRGCAGSRMVKQLPVTDSAGTGKFLSLGVRASRYSDSPLYEDRIDSTDDTGRLEVLAVTNGSYALSQACKDAIDKIMEPPPQGGLNGAQNVIKLCVESFPNANSQLVDMRPTLNHSLQACWQDNPATSTFEINQGHWSQLIADCKALYTGQQDGDFKPSRAYHPSELRPSDGGPYLCYGVYASDIDPNNRAGYMGRCWIQGGGGYVQKYCNQLTTVVAGSTAFGDLKCWKEKTTGNSTTLEDDNDANGGCRNYRNNGGFVEQCAATFENNDNKSQCPSGSWKKVGKWSDGSGYCDYPQNPQQVCPPNTNCSGTWEVSTWPNWEPTNGNCILEAIKDYCDTLKVPEVIDPSEISGKTAGTGDTGNAPALLRDSYLMAYLGGKDPIATMKGHIYQAKRPEGVVHRVAGDLRLGMMSFRYVGAKTECDAADTSAKVEKYCPLNNMDGALLRTPLDAGDYVTSSNDPSYDSGKRRHVDDLAEAINTTRGTSWTPLAEAMYEAIGYYTQNINFCLNKDGSGECIDFPTADNPNDAYFPTVTKSDPVQYWCQDNHILVITEGESTADINEQVKKLSGTIAEDDAHILSKVCPGTCTTHGQDTCLASPLDKLKSGDEDDKNPVDGVDDAVCDDGLYTSSYLDNMTWLGQHVQPLYKDRCVDDAAKESKTEKQAVYTHVVTTGTVLKQGTGECNPDTLMTQAAVNGGTNGYYPGENPQKLEENLYAVFDDILSRSSAGSAASVISSSRSGSGAVYQAVFWPKFEDGDPDNDGTSNKVSWVGDVHSLFVSSKGLMYEDTNQDGKLEPIDEGGSDRRVLFYFSNAANRTRGCYDPDAVVTAGQCPEPAAAGDDLVPECDPDNGHKCVELQDIKYIWSANKNLADRDVASNRKLFTWNDFNNNGIVDTNEWFKLDDKVDWTALNTEAAKTGTRGPVTKDFLKEEDVEDLVVYDALQADKMEGNALKTLMRWLQGVDVLSDGAVTDTQGNTWTAKALRSRKFTFKTKSDEGLVGFADKTWRLGDIIHSTPMVVAKPAESYHYIYRDPTYSKFADTYVNRRNMVYFGGNDGMLHAVNGGFYANNQFCCVPFSSDGTCSSAPKKGVCGVANDAVPDLGEEMWSYIPYNLQPHLKCLADRFYAHKSYVDLKPRIFDAQIFKEDASHPGGWGTILVGGMRFGGPPVLASELNDSNDNRKFISAYFVLDITNPEDTTNYPKLLGEMTQTVTKDADGNYVNDWADMQYTTSSPSLIIMRDGGVNAATTTWYLTLGSGPAEQNGTNNSGAHGKIAVIPMEWLGGALTWSNGVPNNVGGGQPFRIPKTAPNLSSEGGVFTVPPPNGDSTSASFISDIISVDYNIEFSDAEDKLGARYRTDAVYFGTTDGVDFEKYPSGYLSGAADQFYWNGGGRVFRLVTQMLDTNGKEIVSKPSKWADKWNGTDSSRALRLLADVKMPVVGAQAVGYDGWNYWVYAGTGRFYGEKDKTDDGWCIPGKACDSSDKTGNRSSAAVFGIKEPVMDELSGFNDWKSSPPSSFTCDDNMMTWGKINWDINTQSNDNLSYDGEVGTRGLMRTDNILVGDKTGYLYCYNCKTDTTDETKYVCTKLSDTECFPNEPDPDGSGKGMIWDDGKGHYTFDNLKWYIAGEYFNPNNGAVSGCIEDDNGKKIQTGVDGWYHAFHDSRERNLGAPALLGGLMTFTTYQPYNDKCEAEGQSYLYGIHFQTGTAWTETVFGTLEDDDFSSDGDKPGQTIVKNKMGLGRGLSTTPSMHVGSDSDSAAKAFIQTSTGEIIEVEQKNLPIPQTRSGRQNWNDRLGEQQ